MNNKNFVPDEFFFLKYLGFLRLKRENPSLDYLERIVAAQLARVPFENVSKLWYNKTKGQKYIPMPEQYMEGLFEYNFGGTCYTVNYYLYHLLCHLGFDAKIFGGKMSGVNDHMVIIVNIDRTNYLIDAGYAAPFTKPMRITNGGKQSFITPANEYMFIPCNEEGNPEIEMYRHGKKSHGYEVLPGEQRLEAFDKQIRDSFSGKSVFMNNLLYTRYGKERQVRISNLNFRELNDGELNEGSLPDNEEVYLLLEKQGIPYQISSEAFENITLDMNERT